MADSGRPQMNSSPTATSDEMGELMRDASSSRMPAETVEFLLEPSTVASRSVTAMLSVMS